VLDTLARVLAAKGNCTEAQTTFARALADAKAQLDPLPTCSADIPVRAPGAG